MLEYYKMAFDKYADFKTRSTRGEFWWFFLANFLISIGFNILSFAFIASGSDGLAGAIGILSMLYSLAILVPYISVGARRLHDTGRSGWYQLLMFIPLIGIIILIVFWAQEGKPEANEWGPAPGSSGQLDDALVDFDKDIV